MDYRSMVNPTYLTAKNTLLMLAGAGNKDAKKLIPILKTQDELNSNREKADSKGIPMPEADLKALMAGTTLAVEARYESLSRILTEGTYTGLLDIACGYTPRAIFCSRSGIDYVGLDVPVVAEELQKASEQVGLESDHPVYVGGDATNAASLSKAADLLKGSILISCEGLLQYLSSDEFEQLIGGIREILLRHGGAWVSSDFGVDYEAFATANMSSPDAAEMYNKARRLAMKSSSIFNEGVAFWNEEEKQRFLEEHGLKVEKIPFYCADESLTMLNGIPEAWKMVFLRNLQASFIWKMTADASYDKKDAIEGAKTVDNLEISYRKENGVLFCKVSGRVDTISAPALLEVFEQSGEDISAIQVDAEALEYISSAGLRVLMMAAKKLGQGKVTMHHASDLVKEIFETSGFDQVISVG